MEKKNYEVITWPDTEILYISVENDDLAIYVGKCVAAYRKVSNFQVNLVRDTIYFDNNLKF